MHFKMLMLGSITSGILPLIISFLVSIALLIVLPVLCWQAADDDDDLDLFGDETEEDKKAAEEREAAKKSAKKKESK